MKLSIESLIDISTYAGYRVDYTQGGGGNTSVKTQDGKIMLIKASGYKLKDVCPNNAFVCVDREKIFSFYQNVPSNDLKEMEKLSAQVVKDATLTIEGLPSLRPSVEVGFHAILSKYVIHTHSVYANVLACSNEGELLAQKLFEDKDYGVVFLPYINPGFELTLEMKSVIENFQAQNGKLPEVIFMKNHGLVVTSDTLDRVKDVHTDVNLTIEKYFNLTGLLTEINLTQSANGYLSKTKIVSDFVGEYGLDLELLNKYPLYPDQLVYLNNLLYATPELMKIDGKGVEYNTDLKQATTLEETLAAYAFVIKAVKENGLTLSTMNQQEVAFINGWEAEKYRRSVK